MHSQNNGTATPAAEIEVDGDIVEIRRLRLRAGHVAQYLSACEDDERAEATASAIEVGVFCLERASGAQDLDFVRERCESVISEVARTAAAIPGEIERALTERLGTRDGQVLAPVREMLDQTARVSAERLSEVRDTLRNELDPARQTSTLGRSLSAINGLLNAESPGSVQARVLAAVDGMSAEDGALAKCVQTVLAKDLEPLAREVRALALEVRGAEAAARAVAETTLKGFSYEEQIVVEIEAWARSTGSEVEHTGPDNKPGDIRMTPSELLAAGSPSGAIIIECRDRSDAVGRKAISTAVEKAMVERDATAAVYLAATPAALAKEIGTWAEGRVSRGPWVATTRENLQAALRLLLVLRKVEAVKAAAAELDERAVTAQVERVRTALRRIAEISRNAGIIRGGADAVQREGDALRAEVSGALLDIEELVRRAARAAEQA